MKKAIRCCLSCIFPCGALDVIRIVHCSGKVEEISGKVKASEIMEAYPKHVLKKPCTSSYENCGVVSKIVIVPPDAELQRGKIYFLMPLPSSRTNQEKGRLNSRRSSSSSRKKERLDHDHDCEIKIHSTMKDTQNTEQYLNKLLVENVTAQRERRRGGHVGVWRPSLDSVSEILSVSSGKSDE